MTRRILIVTGSRAEFGLLRPLMHAVRRREGLGLMVVAAGSHLVSPAETYREVKAEFGEYIADAVPMQTAGRTGRIADAEALGAGVSKFTRVFERLSPDWVVVLGDRIEALAAGVAASVGGWSLAHVHGGDRAEGIADEAMRHAISKLAHLHFAATPASAARLVRMGEDPDSVHTVGSPAIDGLDAVPPISDETHASLGSPKVLFLLHPVGRSPEHEEAAASAALSAASEAGHVLALQPNLDAGREGITRAIESWRDAGAGRTTASHLPRAMFVGLLKRLASSDGVMVGNSSAALIEAAALRLPAVDIGTRQHGRERFGNVVPADREDALAISDALRRALALDRSAITHGYGDGRAGERIAEVLAGPAGAPAACRRKCCAY